MLDNLQRRSKDKYDDTILDNTTYRNVCSEQIHVFHTGKQSSYYEKGNFCTEAYTSYRIECILYKFTHGLKGEMLAKNCMICTRTDLWQIVRNLSLLYQYV